jgi:hypothetical protein
MRATVMRRGDLDVLVNRSAVAVVVFDSDVGELDMALVVRQLVLARPPLDLLRVSFGSPRRVPAATTGRMKETLVIALELLFQNDSANTAAAGNQAIDSLLVRAIQPDVVCQFSWLRNAGMEGLLRLVTSCAPGILEHRPTALGERDEGCPFLTDDIRRRLNQTKLAEMCQIAGMEAAAPRLVSKIAIRNDSKCADRRKCSNLGSPQRVLTSAHPHAFPAGPSRQIEIA